MSDAVYAPPVQRLITELGKLPGIGNRTAQRLAFHLLRSTDEDATHFVDTLPAGFSYTAGSTTGATTAASAISSRGA